MGPDGASERAKEARLKALWSSEQGDIELAFVHATEARRFALESNDPLFAATCFELLGDVSLRLGRIEEARRELSGAADLYRQQGNLVGEANIELSYAHLADRVGDIAGAGVHFAAALDLYQRAGRLKGQAQAHSGLAFVESTRGRLDRAEQHCDRAVALLEDLHDPEAAATARATRAWIRSRRDPQAAIGELQDVLRRCEERGDGIGVANTRRWLMEANATLGDIARAQVHFRAALRAYRAVGSARGEAMCWSFNADLLLRCGDPVGAERAFAAAETHHLAAGSRYGAANACVGRGRLVIARGAIEEGLAVLARARDLAAEAERAGAPPGKDAADPGAMRASLESFATAVASLSPTARLLLEVLSNVEEVDRSIGIARPALTWFWQGFGHAGPPLPFDAAVAELQQCGFVAVLGAGATEEYRIPPPVIDLTRALTDPTHTKRILTSIGATWAEQFQRDAGAPGPRTVRAGLGAAVYLKRMGSFADSFTWFEAVLEVAKATGEAWHVVPHLYLLALASGDANLAARLEELEQRGALDAKRAGP